MRVNDCCSLACEARAALSAWWTKSLRMRHEGQRTSDQTVDRNGLLAAIAHLLILLLTILASFISHRQLLRIPCIQSVLIRARQMPSARTAIQVCTHRHARAQIRAIPLPRHGRQKWPARGAIRGLGFMARTECLGL